MVQDSCFVLSGSDSVYLMERGVGASHLYGHFDEHYDFVDTPVLFVDFDFDFGCLTISG